MRLWPYLGAKAMCAELSTRGAWSHASFCVYSCALSLRAHHTCMHRVLGLSSRGGGVGPDRWSMQTYRGVV